MKSTLFFVFTMVLAYVAQAQVQIKRVSGIVVDEFNEPLKNVNILVKETEHGIKTDKQGRYAIMVDEGQTLKYSYVGKQSVEIIVEDVTNYLNLTLFDKVEELDEVVITKRTRKTQKELFKEYDSNENLIKTSFGILDKERASFSLKIIDGDRLSRAGRDFLDALRSWIPGIRVFRPNEFIGGGAFAINSGRTAIDLAEPIVFLPRALRTSFSPGPAAYDVDGVVYTTAPTFIQVQNIKRIGVIESFAGISAYGTIGAGGIIVINTKTANFSPREPGTDKPYDQAKLRNNFYEEGSAVIQGQGARPTYMIDLFAADSSEKTKTSFETLERSYSASPHFYLDALDFFKTENDLALRDRIMNTIENRFDLDSRILKALAYKLEESKEFKRANELYKKVFTLRPHYPQSYLDLANSYRSLGEVEKAATIFARFQFLVEKDFFKPAKSFSTILDKDFNNLLSQNNNLIQTQKDLIKVGGDGFKGTRMVFEWNDGEAEFILQFVGPNGQYHNWKHSLKDNAERIREEKIHGFSSQEFLVYDPEKGPWQVNITYLGNKSLTPTYLKTTVYHGFGTKNQTEEVKVFKLDAKNVNIVLLNKDTSLWGVNN